MKFKNIIFDFDGTLIDTRPGIIGSFKKVVKELAKKEIDNQRIIKLIGSPLTQIISILLATNSQPIIERGSELFKKYYNEEGVHQNIIYPEIKKMLFSFEKESLKLFIVSNKIELFINKILAQHDIKEYFFSVYGTDGTDIKSKKAENLKKLIIKHNLKKEETAMAGDTKDDILAGRESQIYSIGVTWGYGAESDLIEAGADNICHTPLELRQLIEKK